MSASHLIEEEAWTDFETSMPMSDDRAASTESDAIKHSKNLKLSDIYAVSFVIRYWQPVEKRRQTAGETRYEMKTMNDLVAIPKDADFETAVEVFKQRADEMLPQAQNTVAGGGKVTYSLCCDKNGDGSKRQRLDENNWLVHVKWWLKEQHKAHGYRRYDEPLRCGVRTGGLEMQVYMTPAGCDRINATASNVVGERAECVMQ